MRYCGSVLALFAAACLTVNVHLHLDKLEESLKERERQINRQSLAPEGEQGRLRSPGTVVATAFAAPQQGDEPNLRVDTPVMREISQRRVERQRAVREYLANGVIGEANDGRWVIRTEEGLERHQRVELRRIVEAENRDREAEWRELLRANGWERDLLPRIRAYWTRARRGSILEADDVPGSWMLQDDEGEWLSKAEWIERERRRRERGGQEGAQEGGGR
jgi:hypothetical protein